MNNVQDFFNSLAPNWDSLCFHHPKKVAAIVSACGINDGDKILDIACGTGVLFQELLSYEPAKIIGVDIAEKMLEQASMKFADPRIILLAQDIYLVEETECDLAIIYSAYPHFEDKQALIQHIAQQLKPNGRLMIAHSQSKEAINGHHDDHAAEVSTGLIPATEEAKRLTPYFDVDIMVDTNELYMVSGRKK